MNKFLKFIKVLFLIVVIGLGFVGVFNVVIINFNNGVVVFDGFGLISQYIDFINGGLLDYFIEIFDLVISVLGFFGIIVFIDLGFE